MGAVSCNGTLPDGPPFMGQSEHLGNTEREMPAVPPREVLSVLSARNLACCLPGPHPPMLPTHGPPGSQSQAGL